MFQDEPTFDTNAAQLGLRFGMRLRVGILELELKLLQTQMAQKPMLRAEVYAHAMRTSQNRKKRKCRIHRLADHLKSSGGRMPTNNPQHAIKN